ncbi:hypothetical protein V8C35DRAFT_326684 [Trichoderma chlorosporum]
MFFSPVFGSCAYIWLLLLPYASSDTNKCIIYFGLQFTAYPLNAMAYYQFNDPATPFRDAVSFDGVPDDLVPSGFVESRIRQLNTMSSSGNPDAQISPYAVNTREGAGVCSPVCPRTRIEVPASPPVGHSYPGVRINDNHSDDNGVAWEVASTSAHMFNVKPNLRGSRSNNSLRMRSPTRGLSRFKSLNRLKQSGNEDDNNDTKSGFKLSRRSQANPQASSSSVRTGQEAPESLRNEQQAVLEMFDMYGVSRPEGWLSDERERQRASEMETVQNSIGCPIQRAMALSHNIPRTVDQVRLRRENKHDNTFDMNADIAWKNSTVKWLSLSNARIARLAM